MENIIKLNENEAKEFGEFIKKHRKKIISSPKDVFNIAIKSYKKQINKNTISRNIKELRQCCYDIFLEQENNFNAFILSNIADNFNMPNKILNDITKEFYKLSNANYDNFKHNFKECFGKYAGAISPYIYALCLSNTNARRSRAGKTFESVIYYLYSHFDFSFNAQANIGKNAFSSLGLGKVVDSILPNIDAFKKRRNKCIVGSMKTSLRERWQEVVEEISRSNLPNIYLLTCDDDISVNKIIQMREHNIILVVFDEVKNELKNYESVVSFENYFSDEIPAIMEYWNAKNN